MSNILPGSKPQVDPKLEDLAFITQDNKPRNSTLQKIKNLFLGTTNMGTTATTITGAVAEVNSQLNDKANLRDVKIFYSIYDIGLSDNDMTTDFSSNVLKMIKAMGKNRELVLSPYSGEANLNLYNSVKKWCGVSTDSYKVVIYSSYNGGENLPNKIEVYPNTNNGENKYLYGFYDNSLGTCKEVQNVEDTGWIDLPLLNGATTTDDKAMYRRIGKMVYFKGTVNNITTNDFIFGNLPIGFRPNSASGGGNIVVPLFLLGEDSPNKLNIYKNGNLQLSRKNDRNSCFLDSVMFVLD